MLLTVIVCGMLRLLETPSSMQAREAVTPQEVLATISGRVVDEKGEPVDHVYVASYPVLKGTFTHAQTDETGRFTLSVAKDGLYMVVLEAEESDPSDKSAPPDLIQPGRAEVKLVLHRVNRLTFVVLDDATGAPIERYGLGIASKPNLGMHGGIDQQEIELRPHPRGESVAHADPSRHVVRVQAPGYASVESEIVLDESSRTRQTLRLRKGGFLFGRVATEGRPLVHASVGLVGGPFGTVFSGTERYEADSWFLNDYRSDLDEYVGRPRLVESAADGSFRIDDLSTGTYDLIVESPGLGPVLLRKIRVDAGEGRDVGVLALGAPASLRGRVVVGPGVSPVGMKYSIDGYQRQAEIANADGTFTIDGLGAGLHQLTMLRSASLPIQDEREVRLASGETREIVFDLSSAAPCTIEVHVMRAGTPADVARVSAILTVEVRAPGLAPWKGTNTSYLVRTKEAGSFTGSLSGGHEVHFEAFGENGLRLGRSPAETLPSGGRLEIQIALDTGSLEFVIAENIELPEYGFFEVTLKRGEEQIQTFVAPRERSAQVSRGRLWSSHRCDLGDIESGEYRVQVRAESTGVDAAGNHDPGLRKTLIGGFSTTVTVKSGERTVVPLP